MSVLFQHVSFNAKVMLHIYQLTNRGGATILFPLPHLNPYMVCGSPVYIMANAKLLWEHLPPGVLYVNNLPPLIYKSHESEMKWH